VLKRYRNKARHRSETAAHYKPRVTLEKRVRGAMVELIGAAFLLLCITPLLARDPNAQRHR
jgi:hypothetical protein